jgi:hypothetical protein
MGSETGKRVKSGICLFLSGVLGKTRTKNISNINS